MIHGWGINDSPTPILTRNPKWRCPFYSTWSRMVERCHSIRTQERHPTYKGCTITSEWQYFTKFKVWMEKQDWEGKQLDKDLLVKGNKEYSPETCIFVTAKVNSFMTKADAKRGSLPLGVVQGTHSYTVQCCALDGKAKHVGSYKTIEAAEKAYHSKKFEYAVVLAGQQTDRRVAQALIEYYKV